MYCSEKTYVILQKRKNSLRSVYLRWMIGKHKININKLLKNIISHTVFVYRTQKYSMNFPLCLLALNLFLTGEKGSITSYFDCKWK